MSEYHPPSYFAEQAELYHAHDYIDVLGISIANGYDFEVPFGNDQYLDVPDTLTNDQNVISAQNTFTDRQSPATALNAEPQPQVDASEVSGGQEGLSNPQSNTPAIDFLNDQQIDTSLPNVEHESPFEPNELNSDQGEDSSLQDFISEGNNLPDIGLPNVGQQPLFEPNEFIRGGVEFPSLQKAAPSHNALDNTQVETGLPNDSQGFQDEYTAEGWTKVEDHMASNGYSEALNTDTYEPYSRGKVDDVLELSHVPTNSRQLSSLNTPGMKSGSSKAGMSAENVHDLMPAGASNQTGNAVGHSGPASRQGASAIVNDNTAATSPADENQAALDDADPEDSDEDHDEEEDDSEYEEPDVPTQATLVTYEENDPLIQEDAHAANWGRTGRRNGHEVWFNPQSLKWQPSASHHDMRQTLIARAQAEYPNDRYDHPDEIDGLPHGETAFFKPHQNRGPDRKNCADELFGWREARPKKDENGRPIRRPKPKYTGKHPGYMYEGDKILLDPHNNPVVNHKFIPLTLSIRTDGAKLQEMALRPQCRQVDLWARMPRWERAKDKYGNYFIRELRGKNTRINMPMTRFREKKGTISGEDRDGTEVIREGLLKFYRHHGFDPVASGNSTKSFPRDLKAWEVKEVRLGNAAKFGKRAGTRALDAGTREENLQRIKKSIENGKRRAARKGDDAGNQRQEDEAPGSQDSNVRPKQRLRRTQKVDARLRAREEQYTEQPGAPTVEDAQNGYGVHGNQYTRQQDIAFQSLLPQQGLFDTSGASNSPYQHPNFQTQHLPAHNQFDGDHDFSGLATSFIPVQDGHQQAPYGGFEMQQARDPRESLNHPGTQEFYSQRTARKLLPTGPRTQNRMPAVEANNDNISSQSSFPAGQYPHENTSTGRFSAVRPDAPQQNLRPGVHHDLVQDARYSRFQSGAILNAVPAYHLFSRANSNRYGPPVQRGEPLQGINGVPQRGGNTLGPGGRQTHLAPKPVLGKRGRQDSGEVSPATMNGTRQEQGNVELAPDSDARVPHKRRRNNETPGTELMPQRRPHIEKTPQRRHYGAEGAPQSLLLSEETPGSTQPISDLNGDAEDPLKSPGELFGSMQPSYDFGGDAEGPLIPPEELFRDMFGSQDVANASNENEDQGTNDIPGRHSESVQRISEGWVPQQVLGKRGREQRLNEGHQEMYVPTQIREGQGKDVNWDEGTDEPKLKRPRLPTNKGYYSPPAKPSKAAVVQKARKADRDARLLPPQSNINEPVSRNYEASVVEDEKLTPPEHNHLGERVMSLDEKPLLTNAQGHSLPQTPLPAQAERQTHFDIRDVRPMDGGQAESLNNAIKYTREAYLEWTGEEAPPTNPGDCYNVQYREILAAFQIWWESEKNPQRSEPVPELYHIPAWSGSVQDWKAPENVEHLFEPMKRGRWAARNPDGSLQKPEFDWNFEDFEF